MAIVFQKPKALTDAVLHYCPGCTHGIVHRLVAEAIDELGIEGRTIGIAPVGCSVMAYDYFACDMIEASSRRTKSSTLQKIRLQGPRSTRSSRKSAGP